MSIIKKKFKIEGMHCSACAMNIDFDLEEIAGIKKVNTKYASEICEVEFDENKITEIEIIKKVNDIGYKAKKYLE